MLVCSRWACDALARSDLDQASVMMVKRTEYGVVCPVARGNCGWPHMSHGGASPRSPRWDNPIPCHVPHTVNGASVVRGLVATPGAPEESGTNAPFWPGACAANL